LVGSCGSHRRRFVLPIDEEILAPLKLIYAKIAFLRYALCLPPASLVPWDVWVAKSHLAFNDHYELYWAVFDEVVEYLKPIVTETLDAAAHRLRDRDAATADVTAINWAEARRQPMCRTDTCLRLKAICSSGKGSTIN
jgi:hypothetical protein